MVDMYIVVTAHRLPVLLCSSQALSKSPPSIPIRRGLNSCIASYVIAFGPIVSSRRVIHANWSERNYVIIIIMFYLPEHIVKTSRMHHDSRRSHVYSYFRLRVCVPRRIPRAYCTTVWVYVHTARDYRESIRTAHCSAGQTSFVRIVVRAVFRPRFERVSHDSSDNASRTTAVVAAHTVWGVLIDHVHVAPSVFARVSGAGTRIDVGLAGPVPDYNAVYLFVEKHTPQTCGFYLLIAVFPKDNDSETGRADNNDYMHVTRAVTDCTAHKFLPQSG